MLSNTTLGVLLATLDASITLIAMPDIFRGIKLDPLVSANSFYLLWMNLAILPPDRPPSMLASQPVTSDQDLSAPVRSGP